MAALDIFNDDAFSVHTLTAKINEQPYRPGQISDSGLFSEASVSTTIVSIELMAGNLSLVEPSVRGGPGETIGDDKRRLIPFEVDHYQRDDSVTADEVQNVRAFGTESEVETVQGRVIEKAARHLGDLDMTIEHQRVGAIKGIVTSKSGRVLHNLYDRFEIAVPAEIVIPVSNADAKLGSTIKKDVIYGLEDDLDTPYSGVDAWTGRDFHSALWNHKSVRETFIYHNGAEQLRREEPDEFEFAGVRWKRYRTGRKASADNRNTPYIAADEARLVPTGVPELFITRFAPADYEETVNTPGLPRYMRQWAKPNGKGREMEVQTNPISLCTRPQALRKLKLG